MPTKTAWLCALFSVLVFELPSKEWHQVSANMHILYNLYLYGRIYVHVSTKGRNYTLAKEPVLSMPQSVVVLPLLLHGQIEMLCFKILIQKGLHNAVNSPRTENSVIIYLQ